jgi:DNA invertase Pin-like site-specific DNA recombinase
LRKAIDALGEGDVLMVTRLDRLARSTRDLLNVLHEVGEKGAAFRSLADTWADTTTPHGRLMVTVLGGLAEFERSLIRARTDVGIRRAREAGIRFGRPPKLTKHQQHQALKLLDQGEPQSAIARLLNVDQSTISRLATRSAA